jgi:peroxiredoxin
MNSTITKLLSLSALLLVAGAPEKPTGAPEKQKAEIGKDAPEFELKDHRGKTHKLSDYKEKIVVLEWFNETCPFCMNAWAGGLLPKLLEDLDEVNTDVVYLAINSTANRPEEEVLKGGKEFLEELEVSVPMLMDYSGDVGHAYGAKTTPHMFVIDTNGVLVYEGALSDDKRFKQGKKAETHVLRAVKQVDDGEEVSPSHVKPWGCSVKYKNGAQRPERGKRPGRVPRGPRT